MKITLEIDGCSGDDKRAGIRTLKALDAYIDKLQHIRSMIDNEDEEGNYNLMKEANDIRRILKGKRKEEE